MTYEITNLRKTAAVMKSILREGAEYIFLPPNQTRVFDAKVIKGKLFTMSQDGTWIEVTAKEFYVS